MYAVPVLTAHIAGIPDDPSFSGQWDLNNTGQNGGTPDADINAPEAWDVTTGSPEVVIAVVDTGVDYSHPDLAANMWVNPGEIPGNGIDDDGDGYVDDVHGINVITGTGDPMDDHAHGTGVAGEIAAAGNNGSGVAGVCWSAKIVSCKFMGSDGQGTLDNAIRCLEYLYDLKTRATNPVNLVAVNASWTDSPFYQPLADAIEKLASVGVLFVASAGNAGVDNGPVHGTGYPASYEFPNVIAVGATDNKDALWHGSSFGRSSVHLLAPGGTPFPSTIPGGTYGPMYATSAAAPLVTGVVGLLAAQDPSRDWLTLRNLIVASGQPIAAAASSTITGRRLRAWDTGGVGALTCAGQVVAARVLPRTDVIYVARGQSTVPLALLSLDCGRPNGGTEVAVTPGGGWVPLLDDGVGTDKLAGDAVYSGMWTVPAASDVATYTLGFAGDAVEARVVEPYPAAGSTAFSPRALDGTKLVLADESVQTIESPFAIHFGNDPVGRSTLYVTSNGTIVFSDDFPWGLNERLPATRHDAVIAPLWDDLDPGAGGGVYWGVLGTSPDRELVVEWRDVPFYGATTGGSVSFQVVLFEESSDIVFEYTRTETGDPVHDNGAHATVGVQVAADAATEVSYDTASLSSGTALRWPGKPFAVAPPIPVPPAPDVHSQGLGCSVGTPSALGWLGVLAALARRRRRPRSAA
jgi:subtilisin family serine protease